MTNALAALLILLAPPPPLPGTAETYVSEDLTAKTPGPKWRLRTAIEGAPNVRGVYTYHREPDKGRNRSSLISFTIENEPAPPEPEKYVAEVMAQLGEPPLSFKRTKGGPFTSKGMEGWKQDYTDRDGLRQFTQIALKMADGRLLLINLQSPDAEAYAADLGPLRDFLDGIAVKPRKVAPAPR